MKTIVQLQNRAWLMWVSVLLAWLVCGPAGQPMAAQDSRAALRVVQEILDANGTHEMLRKVGAVVQADLDRQLRTGSLSAEKSEAYRAWFEIIQEGSSFEQDLIHGMMEGFNPELAQAALEWLRSPLGRKLLQMEMELYAVDLPEQLALFRNSREGRELMGSRGRKLRSDPSVAQQVEWQLDLHSAQEQARLSVENNARPPEEKLSEEAMSKVIGDLRNRLRERIMEVVVNLDVFKFRNATDEEIDEFRAFFETEAGVWYAKAWSNALAQAWTSAGIRLGGRSFAWPTGMPGSIPHQR